MKIVDFNGELAPNGQITVPPEIASQVPPGAQVKVVLQWGSSEEDSVWRVTGRRQFEAAYADDDAIYECLIHDTPIR